MTDNSVLQSTMNILSEANRLLLHEEPQRARELYTSLDDSMKRHPGVQNNVALSWQLQQDYETAIECYVYIVKQFPDYVRARVNLANCKRYMGENEEAIMLLEFCKAQGGMPQIYFLLSALYVMSNEMEVAVESMVKGLMVTMQTEAVDTLNYVQCYYENFNDSQYVMRSGSATLLDCLYTERLTPSDVLVLHQAFDSSSGVQRSLTLSKHGGLRVGLVSEHFKYGAMAGFIMPLLTNTPQDVTVICYHLSPQTDAVTQMMAEKVLLFRHMLPGSARPFDVEAARSTILQDGLDVLISLDGHTGNTVALHVMSSRLARVQIDYLGYPATTGHSNIDFKLVDAKVNPHDSGELYSEKLLRMESPFLCWQPLTPNAESLRPASSVYLPREEKRLLAPHNFKKLSATTINMYKQILQRCPTSRVYFKSSLHNDPKALEPFFRRRFGDLFSRVMMLDYIDDLNDNIDTMHTFDLALDAFPYNGTTTTIECLYSGLPMLTLSGDTHRSRVSGCLLDAVGHSELVARSEAEFVNKACALLEGGDTLKKLHACLHSDLMSSSLTDVGGFTNRFYESLKALF